MSEKRTKNIFHRYRDTGHKKELSLKDRFLIRTLWVYPLFAAALYLASSMFIDNMLIRLIISSVLAFFPWRESMSKIFSGNYKHLRTQILVLLQVLTTSVSSGYSIERSFELIRPVIEHTFGKRSLLIKPLIALENDLKVHTDLKDALGTFARDINFPETLPVFHALAISSRIGNNSLAILRSSCQMLSEMNAVQNEISASNAGKNAEAAMLCAMPFAITAALDHMGKGYLSSAKASKTGAVLLAAAFVTAIIACALLFRFMSHSEGRSKRNSVIKTTSSSNRTPLTDLLHRFLPVGFISSRHELFNELSSDPKKLYEEYLKKQLTRSLVITTVSMAVLFVIKKSIFWAFPFSAFIIFLGAHDVRHEAELKREEIMQDIPLFLCLIYTLLEAGLQLPKAIEICSFAFRDNKSISEEIKSLRAMILSGISASDAVEKMSLRIQIPEAQSALLLVARYGRLGSAEVLNLLSLQASACWNLCRNAARKKQEREALGLLFPMTLDFVCVLLVAITPAIISLSI